MCVCESDRFGKSTLQHQAESSDQNHFARSCAGRCTLDVPTLKHDFHSHRCNFRSNRAWVINLYAFGLDTFGLDASQNNLHFYVRTSSRTPRCMCLQEQSHIPNLIEQSLTDPYPPEVERPKKVMRFHQNGTSLAGKMMPHPAAVFATIYRPPAAIYIKNQMGSMFLYVR